MRGGDTETITMHDCDVQGVRESDSETIMFTAIRSSCLPCTIDDTPLHVASRDAVSWNSGERWGDDDSAGCEDWFNHHDSGGIERCRVLEQRGAVGR